MLSNVVDKVWPFSNLWRWQQRFYNGIWQFGNWKCHHWEYLFYWRIKAQPPQYQSILWQGYLMWVSRKEHCLISNRKDEKLALQGVRKSNFFVADSGFCKQRWNELLLQQSFGIKTVGYCTRTSRTWISRQWNLWLRESWWESCPRWNSAKKDFMRHVKKESQRKHDIEAKTCHEHFWTTSTNSYGFVWSSKCDFHIEERNMP